jgi:hypothetical protein
MSYFYISIVDMLLLFRVTFSRLLPAQAEKMSMRCFFAAVQAEIMSMRSPIRYCCGRSNNKSLASLMY